MAKPSVEDLITQLRDEDPVMRIKACDALGKLGDHEAIPELVRVYQQEDDLVVQEAAENALRRLGKEDGGGGGGSSGLRNLAVLLVISLVVLIALNVVTRMSSSDDADATEVAVATQAADPTNRDILLTDYAIRLINALDDVTALREEWTPGAGALACTATLNRPETFVVQDIDRQTYPDIAFVDDYNMALTTLQTVTADWDAACASEEKGTEEQRTAAFANLDIVQGQLDAVAVAINEATVNPAPTTSGPTAVPAATLSVTLTSAPTVPPTVPPTPTPRPTISPELGEVIRDLDRIIGNTETELNSLINNKWLFLERGEVSPFGCSGASLDGVYMDASEELLASQEDLAAIITILNEALTSAQASSELYATNCTAGTINATIIANGLEQAQSSFSSIQLAKSEIDRLYR